MASTDVGAVDGIVLESVATLPGEMTLEQLRDAEERIRGLGYPELDVNTRQMRFTVAAPDASESSLVQAAIDVGLWAYERTVGAEPDDEIRSGLEVALAAATGTAERWAEIADELRALGITQLTDPQVAVDDDKGES